MNKIKIEKSWESVLHEVFQDASFSQLIKFVKEEYSSQTIYPKASNIFRAFNLCPFHKVSVVILGQDPYHGEGQADGLAFSVNEGIKIPPSLLNIYKEIENDLGEVKNNKGDLSKWAEQGVLLLNSILTVRANKPASHQNKGWEIFTDQVIKILSREKEHLIYILWGSYAQNKGRFINRAKNLVLESVHPSPLSAHKGFFNNNFFSKTNNYLTKYGKNIILW